MIYDFAKGSRHKVSAQVAGEVCAELEKQGRLTAKTVVDESRPEDAPLHAEFEWNDSEAAENWREQQARNLINTIIIVPDKKESAPATRAYYNIEYNQPKYESIQAIVSKPDRYELLLARAKNELRAFQKKYAAISELENVFTEIERLVS